MAPAHIYMKDPVTDRLLLIDGFTRSGKMLMGKLLSNLDRVESFQAHEPIEHIATFAHFGIMDAANVTSLLRLHIDIAVYNRIVGRNLNLRKDDSSSIEQALNAEDYIARAGDSDKDSLLRTFNEQQRVPLFMTHECLPYADVFFAAAPGVKIVEMVRHPADLTYSWWKRGWGERWGTDPLAFNLACDHDGSAVPIFAVDWAEEYLAMKPVDRVVRSLDWLQRACDKAVAALTPAQREQVVFVPYEQMLLEPRETMDRLCDFIGTAPLSGIETVYEREKLPAVGLQSSTAKRFDQIRQHATPESLRILEAASAEYAARHGVAAFA